jgi:hypothetical protein
VKLNENAAAGMMPQRHFLRCWHAYFGLRRRQPSLLQTNQQTNQQTKRIATSAGNRENFSWKSALA